MTDTPPIGQRQRRDRLIREHEHDPYMVRSKLPEPSVCPQCGVAYQDGRWQWLGQPPENPHEELCPACRRTNDHHPAGIVRLEGGFLRAHEEEILNLARHEEGLENGEHPLHRIMAVEHEDGALVIKTTDIHLPRRIGEAVDRAYNGTLDFHYEEEAYLLRVAWSREA